MSLIECRKHFHQLLSGLYSYPYLVICQYMRYPSGRNLAYFKICFKMKCRYTIRDMLLALAMSQIVYLPSFLNYLSGFWDICLACYSNKSAKFCCIFNRLCASQNFFSPRKNCLLRYLIILINFPNSVKFCITKWPNKNMSGLTDVQFYFTTLNITLYRKIVWYVFWYKVSFTCVLLNLKQFVSLCSFYLKI